MKKKYAHKLKGKRKQPAPQVSFTMDAIEVFCSLLGNFIVTVAGTEKVEDPTTEDAEFTIIEPKKLNDAHYTD